MERTAATPLPCLSALTRFHSVAVSMYGHQIRNRGCGNCDRADEDARDVGDAMESALHVFCLPADEAVAVGHSDRGRSEADSAEDSVFGKQPVAIRQVDLGQWQFGSR